MARKLFERLPPRYDRLAAVLSLGQDRRWRAAVVGRTAAAQPSLVLDVATGPGGVALALAARSNCRIVGIDLSPQMLGEGRRNVAAAGRRDQITLVLGQGERLPFPDGAFDGVMFSYLLRYVADPAGTIAELARVVRPGGTVASLEFAVPGHPVWLWSWRLYTRAVLPLAGALLGGRPWFTVGRFLGPNIEDHYRRFPLAATVDAWEAAGLADVTVRPMSLGGGVVMSGRRTSPP